MIETLRGMSPSKTDDLLEQPSLAESAVAGVRPGGPGAAEEQVEVAEPSAEELAIARELVRSARARGVAMTGPGGMLKALTKTVIETALDEEMVDHLGYDRHEAAGRGSGNSRNGTRTKTVLTDNVGPVQVEVPRDRDGSFDPVIVRKRQRRLGGVDTIVLSLVAKGLTTGEVSAPFEEIYGASLSKDTISKITDRVLTEMAEWSARRRWRVLPSNPSRSAVVGSRRLAGQRDDLAENFGGVLADDGFKSRKYVSLSLAGVAHRGFVGGPHFVRVLPRKTDQ